MAAPLPAVGRLVRSYPRHCPVDAPQVPEPRAQAGKAESVPSLGLGCCDKCQAASSSGVLPAQHWSASAAQGTLLSPQHGTARPHFPAAALEGTLCRCSVLRIGRDAAECGIQPGLFCTLTAMQFQPHQLRVVPTAVSQTKLFSQAELAGASERSSLSMPPEVSNPDPRGITWLGTQPQSCPCHNHPKGTCRGH